MTTEEYVDKVQSCIQAGFYGYRKDRHIAKYFLWDDANGGLDTFDFPSDLLTENDVIEHVKGVDKWTDEETHIFNIWEAYFTQFMQELGRHWVNWGLYDLVHQKFVENHPQSKIDTQELKEFVRRSDWVLSDAYDDE